MDFIIVSFNSRQFIGACLESLASFGVPSSRTYVVDNGSVDGTVDYVSRRYPEVSVIQNAKNLGFGKANNVGVGEGHSDILVLVNPDVVLLPGAARKLVEELAMRKATGICGPLFIDGKLRPKPESYLLPQNVVGTALMQLHLWKPVYWWQYLVDRIHPPHVRRRRSALSGACLAIRRGDFLRLGGFDESMFLYSEDLDLCRRVHRSGLDVVQIPSSRVVHFGGGDRTGGHRVEFSTLLLNQLASREILLSKHSNLSSLIAIRFLVALGLFLRWSAYRTFAFNSSLRKREMSDSLWQGLRPFLSLGLLKRKPLRFDFD